MNLGIWLRQRLSRVGLPIWMGQLLAYVPYSLRPGIGNSYRRFLQIQKEYSSLSYDRKKIWITRHVKRIVNYAENNIPFYMDYYSDKGFHSDQIKTFDDLQRIPIIDKTILQEYDIDDRSNLEKPGYLVNTGGTSGRPLDLYVYPEMMGKEWSHMHQIWARLGFQPKDLKLMFTGRSEFQEDLNYDWARHSLSVNVYVDIKRYYQNLKELIIKNRPKFIHGYPSALYEFALGCKHEYPELSGLLKKYLSGAFLGSEYPNKYFRSVIEETFQISTISWYGHTERCILAPEKDEPYLYYPFQTYGFTEVVSTSKGTGRLVGTDYFNLSSPLIRYDTEDEVADFMIEGSLLKSFRIKGGRRGEFIKDRSGKKIPLTALIFGRHHSLFNNCSYIQVYQDDPGHAVVLYVPLRKRDVPNPEGQFDSKNVNIKFDFKSIDEPIKTPSGKIRLLVNEKDYKKIRTR